MPKSDGEPDGFSLRWIFGFLSLHVALALVMKRYHAVATLHGLATFAVGLWLCFGKNRPLQIAQWAAYVVGAEVLWRMCRASIPWEFAKHSIWIICLTSMVRSGRTRGSWLPVLYFALLAPASLPTFAGLPFHEARQQVSTYLCGPMCLAACALCFSPLRLSGPGFQRVGSMTLGPIFGVASVSVFGLATTQAEFGDFSNFAASGGYGPCQVSASLGLGALLAVFLHLGERRSNLLRGGFALLALGLLAQAALTFSRTGIYLFGAAFGAAAVFLTRGKGGAGRLVALVLVLVAGTCVVLPMLNAFTGGKLAARFEDQGLTGRDNIAKLDLQIWRENPVLGVGMGMSTYSRATLGDEHRTHTEYTRLLADHGLVGAAALAVLLVMATRAFLAAPGPRAKAIVAAFAAWAFLFMAVSAMVLAAPAFLLGLIHARFLVDDPAGQAAARKPSRLRQAVPAHSLQGLPGPNRRLPMNLWRHSRMR